MSQFWSQQLAQHSAGCGRKPTSQSDQGDSLLSRESLRGRPVRGRSRRSSKLACMNGLHHLRAVPWLIWSRRTITSMGTPSFCIRPTRARIARHLGLSQLAPYARELRPHLRRGVRATDTRSSVRERVGGGVLPHLALREELPCRVGTEAGDHRLAYAPEIDTSSMYIVPDHAPSVVFTLRSIPISFA